MATLIAVGDCDHARSCELARTRSRDWTGAADGAEWPPTARCRSGARLNVVPRPRAPQSELRIGHVGGARATRPTTMRSSSANTILGGQFVSRINLNLREDKGVTYGARTAFEFRRLPGPFALQVSVQTSGDRTGDRGVDRRDRRRSADRVR